MMESTVGSISGIEKSIVVLNSINKSVIIFFMTAIP
jgi:hypothetical protein